jgi:hypothetical protein
MRDAISNGLLMLVMVCVFITIAVLLLRGLK